MLELHESDEGPLNIVLVPGAGGALLAGTAVACLGLYFSHKVFGTEPSSLLELEGVCSGGRASFPFLDHSNACHHGPILECWVSSVTCEK